jgi:signal-transduction protein with cAMP-binding, CBS, and nucleotidyltransferase domain
VNITSSTPWLRRGREVELRDIVGLSRPVKITSTSTAGEALISMIENKTDYLLIDRSGPNDSYGIITRRDIVVGAVAEGRDLSSTTALEIARKPLVVMNNLDLDLRWVAKKMANEGISKIAVFDKENFLGFISDIDILKAVATKAKKEAKA